MVDSKKSSDLKSTISSNVSITKYTSAINNHTNTNSNTYSNNNSSPSNSTNKSHSPFKLDIIIFLAIFLTIYTLMNYYVLSSYYLFFDLLKGDMFFILLFILTISYLVSSILESFSKNSFFKSIYLISSVWMGVLFISLFIVSIFRVIGLIAGISFMLGVYCLITTLLVSIYMIYSNFNIVVKEFNLYNSKNANIRAVQITDIHLGPVYGKEHLKKIVDSVNSLNPDVVLITGDMLDGKYFFDKDILSPFNDIKCDIYFVCGNHDYYAGLKTLEELLSVTKIKWLRNDVDSIALRHMAPNSDDGKTYGNIDVVGVDDNYDSRQLEATLYSLKTNGKIGEKFTLLLAHRPVGWLSASKYVDLMICGHTHAGQIWPFTYLTYLHNGAISGVYRSTLNRKFMLYVNSGTGTWGPPMRLGTKTEISVFNIMRESTARRSKNN